MTMTIHKLTRLMFFPISIYSIIIFHHSPTECPSLLLFNMHIDILQ